jgi:hypothetical protein
MVTSTTMQSSPRNVADFRDFKFYELISLMLFLCHIFLLLQSDPCLFWACLVRMILRYCYVLSIHVFFAIMEYPSMTQSCSTFAIKCSLQIVYMLINFAEVVVVYPCMLWECSCHGQLIDHVFLLGVCLVCHEMPCGECIELANMPTWICFAMFQFSAKSESVNETCYVYMGPIISYDPFWIMVSMELLLFALSSFMPFLALPWYVPVACCYLALNIASWC